MRTPGATVFADLAETGQEALIALHGLNAALLAERVSAGGAVDDVVAVMALAKLLDRSGLLFVEAADVARAKGWFSHRPNPANPGNPANPDTDASEVDDGSDPPPVI